MGQRLISGLLCQISPSVKGYKMALRALVICIPTNCIV